MCKWRQRHENERNNVFSWCKQRNEDDEVHVRMRATYLAEQKAKFNVVLGTNNLPFLALRRFA